MSGARSGTLRMITELKDITISEAKIESVGEEIGRGAYGKVFTVKYCGWICAAKEIHSILLEGVSQQEQQSIKEGFIRECYHCSILSHSNIAGALHRRLLSKERFKYSCHDHGVDG